MPADVARPSAHGRAALVIGGIVAGTTLGVGFLWAVGWNALLVGVFAVLVGIGVSYLRPPPILVVVTTAAGLTSSALFGWWTQPSFEGAVFGLIQGVVFMLCLVTPVLIAAVLDQRRTYVERGWELARAEAREQDVRVEQAVRRERETMASEIHDGLGHRLTLIAVQAARLSLDESLPVTARTELQRIRANAAAASDELGDTVRLLADRESGITASLSGLGIDDVIARARSSGLVVHSVIDDRIEEQVSGFVKAALLRALQEALTNAAKHAPDSPVYVDLELAGDGDEVTLRVRNRHDPATDRSEDTGHGLVALRHRIAILAGRLDVEADEDFTVTVALPRSASPTSPQNRSSTIRAEAVAAEDVDSARRHRHAVRRAWLIPIALLTAALLSSVGYFCYATVASVLPPERFAEIGVGDSQAQVRHQLPPVQMLDPPRAVRHVPAGWDCRYYEASISFFERDDVFRICFADGEVVSTDTISPDDD